MVQRDGYGISKQIQLDDGREINIQRPYNGQAQVQLSSLPQASSPGQQEVSVGAVLVVSPALLQIPLYRCQGPLPGGAGPKRAAGWKGQYSTLLNTDTCHVYLEDKK